MVACRPVCVFRWQVAPQTWSPWREGSFRREWRAVWGTWHWWTPGRDSSRPRPSTCKPTQPTASTCSRAPHRSQRAQKHTHLHTNTTHRDYGVMSYTHTHTHTHTADSHRETYTQRGWHKLGALLLPKKVTKTKTRWHNRIWCFSVCSKTKKETEKMILTSLLFFSVVFSMKDY